MLHVGLGGELTVTGADGAPVRLKIVGLLAAEELPANIVAGVQDSIAKRIVSMVGGKVEGPVVFTGGVALIPGMGEALSKALKCVIRIALDPQMTAAYGAAVLAAGSRNESRVGLGSCLEVAP